MNYSVIRRTRRLSTIMQWRFSIRSLLIAVTGIAVAVAAVGLYLSYLASRPDNTILTLNGDASMEPYIGARAYFVADLNAYRASSPGRWDAVVFDQTPPATASVLWIAALPGETVSFSNGQMLVDGVDLELPGSVFPNDQMRIDLPDDSRTKHPYLVPKQSYYLLGGNPDAAKDSRSFGAVDESRIVGRVTR
ncbi:signal peptidase I [Aporhodopirellula aestuarii]|uniref:Signal peptidase I n=1 Tax=Aporhodopirellula aestuarii TaxID=2950107 RepID=A0ABT0U452_9BACT|nr:signal peptidase I [Aporhodopirellula aestuarii]MCM2371631.1 signal peptidase I [Aporhodopirellula aestuarii]